MTAPWTRLWARVAAHVIPPPAVTLTAVIVEEVDDEPLVVGDWPPLDAILNAVRSYGWAPTGGIRFLP